jgi:hypothetical protein
MSGVWKIKLNIEDYFEKKNKMIIRLKVKGNKDLKTKSNVKEAVGRS